MKKSHLFRGKGRERGDGGRAIEERSLGERSEGFRKKKEG